MSYALSVYLVPRAELARVRANDQELLAEVLDALQQWLADYDEQMDASSAGDDGDLSHADAMRELFAGKFTPGVTGARYGWAFELLCKAIGQQLSNEWFSPCDWDWYEHLDQILAQRGVPLRFATLLSEKPLPFPEPDDWPFVGHWPASAAAELDAFERTIDALTTSADDDVDEEEEDSDDADDLSEPDGAQTAVSDSQHAREQGATAGTTDEPVEPNENAWRALDTARDWLFDLKYEDDSIIVGFHG